MIKIIKKKTYLGMKDQIGRLTKQILKQQSENNQLRTDKYNLEKTNNTLGNEIEIYQEKINLKDKEIKKLKQLCTKNNVDYKHLYKKEAK